MKNMLDLGKVASWICTHLIWSLPINIKSCRYSKIFKFVMFAWTIPKMQFHQKVKLFIHHFCHKNWQYILHPKYGVLCKQQNITFHDANREDVSQRSLFSFHVLYMLLKLSWLCIKSFLWEKLSSLTYTAFL